MAAIPSPWLDGRVPASQTPTRLLQLGRSDVEVKFVELIDDRVGRVLYPVDSTNEVAAPLSPGVYVAGAVCPAVLGADGRVAMVYPPLALGEGDRLNVGEWTEEVVDMGETLDHVASEVLEQSQVLDAHGSHLDGLDERLADIGATFNDWDNRISGAEDRAEEVGQQVSGAIAVAGQAKEAADAAVVAAALAAQATVKIESTRGTAFKNNLVATDLNVTVFYKDHVITSVAQLHEAFGVSAYLEWWWRRFDDEDFGLISSSDGRLSRGGFTLTVSPDDVDEQTTFRATLNS